MINLTDNMNDQFKQMMDMQTRGLEPLRVFASVAVEAAEKIARQNYAVAGDVLEFSAKQANLPLSSENLTDVASAQMAENNAFVELMNGRATEYADMAQQFNSKVREAAETVSASFK
ncbi:MAG: phasin family protein [Granulosicoccus sp.]|nr:phasin family protein [Granulosicoccus sp.]